MVSELMKKLDLLGDNAVSVGRSPDSCMPPRAPPCMAQGPCESRGARPLPRTLPPPGLLTGPLTFTRNPVLSHSVPNSSSSDASGPVFSVSEPLSVLKFFRILGGAGGPWAAFSSVQSLSPVQLRLLELRASHLVLAKGQSL